MFKKGDRVILKATKFGNSQSNPVWDGIYACVGTIKSYSAGVIVVSWDNSKSNSYRSVDLSPYEGEALKEPNPNVTFKLKR